MGIATAGPVTAAGSILGVAARPVRRGRVAVVASADASLRKRIAETLRGLRWEAREAQGGAELFARMDSGVGLAKEVDAVLLDSWLPDLEIGECVRDLRLQYPEVDLYSLDGTGMDGRPPESPYRNEVLHALRSAQKAETEPAWKAAPAEDLILRQAQVGPPAARMPRKAAAPADGSMPELLGNAPSLLEVSRRIRLVAPRSTAVLVQGPTGTGKELVARALHRLSPRAARSFVALNCAAIPEALLEAELFGHTRGAFTGAVQGRTGRLEAAHGGTLFLDEIGELPLSLQAKLLRFIECGELQRVGENQPVRVDVRIVAATHRKLGDMVAAGLFRADLFYRLSVFLIRTPALAGRADDIRLLAEHAVAKLSEQEGSKTLTSAALERLVSHAWPGNVRELEHTIERAWILAEDNAQIDSSDIDFGDTVEG